MKKIILSVITFMCIGTIALAQIPNNGFENWTSMGTYNNPDSWDQLNATTSFASIYTCIKGTPGNPGTSYLKLVSKSVSGIGVVPGIAATGTINTGSMKVNGGFAFTQRPVKLTGAWQYMAYGSDSGFVAIYLTKWNSSMGMRDTVAMVRKKLSGMVMSWANFNLNLTYKDGSFPDTAQIILSSSGTIPVASSYLYVDNLAFSGAVTATNENTNIINNLSVFPNPATDELSVELDLQKNSHVKMQLVDISGKLVKEINAANAKGKLTNAINLSGITKGIYFLKVMADNSSEVKKVIVE